MQLGEWLATQRKKAGLTQQELAEKLNYNEQFISNWERGKSKPPQFIQHSIAKALRIPCKEFDKKIADLSLENKMK